MQKLLDVSPLSAAEQAELETNIHKASPSFRAELEGLPPRVAKKILDAYLADERKTEQRAAEAGLSPEAYRAAKRREFHAKKQAEEDARQRSWQEKQAASGPRKVGWG